MIYVVLIPAWISATLLGAGWTFLVYLASHRLRFRNRFMIVLLAVMALQALAASSTTIITSRDPLNAYACWMGYTGRWFAFFTTLAEAVVIGFLSRNWPLDEEGKRVRFWTWVATWFGFNLVALLAHLRSAALCTV